ncbi:Cleft lip and palate transmembrane protein 1 [Amphibalanus amphitrite]|uniref:Cleft lip and palate transmembrane protein 1 n=1 Tax=Amphibalanus amphitrite TaxID=1232801 RepID=A0A6A4UX44_AMPAM|nr:Cleft lip and palate transmembrane protein 1 [Amphibalanus amphitrite]
MPGEVAAAGAGSGPVANGEPTAAGGDQQQRPPQQSVFDICKGLVFRAMIIYFISSMFRRSPPQTATGPGGKPTGAIYATNMFENGTFMDMYAYVSESEDGPDFSRPEQLVWRQLGLQYGDWVSGPSGDGIFSHQLTYRPSQAVLNNGSVYLHVYIVREGRSPDPSKGKLYSRQETISGTKRLNKFKRKVYKRTQNLLTGSSEISEEDLKKADTIQSERLSHWHPNMTISIVHDFTTWTKAALVPPIDEYIHFTPSGERYRPILFINDYWNLNKDYMPINDTMKELQLLLTFQPITFFKFQLYSSMGMRNKWTANLLGDAAEENDEDQDSMKEAILETNPYLMALTVAVSLLHSVFEFLAFKNDIQFWNNRESLEGLSVRSVFFGVFQAGVIMLYVLDNDTNAVIRISCAIGMAIECWKITKVSDVKIDRQNRILGIIPRISFEDKGSYVESSTREYDKMAFKYLSWALFPLLGGYAVYSVVYMEHKGWYSWVLSMLYGFLLTFGFIMMTPQLFINYKMKSVAHLPWRMMTYKALNTFIDDMFAFIIKMPMMYRIGCLRDDVVFFIFLYQRYIYRVDPSRVNEFGFSQEMLERKQTGAPAAADQQTAEQPAVAAAPPKSDADKKAD